jgi:SOS-response transcriptional repressor LexA
MDDGTERAIRDGDLVLVDTNLTELHPGKVYVVEILGDGLTVKEARQLGGEWLPHALESPRTRPSGRKRRGC